MIAHATDIFALAVTPTQLISGSGSSSIKICSTADPEFPLVQEFKGAHKLGCHHLATSRSGRVLASAGFGGELKVWTLNEENGQWELRGEIKEGNKAGEVWAIALDTEGGFLASTTVDGRVNVWDIRSLGKPQGEGGELGKERKFREYETKGSFGLCVDISRDGKYTASGHQNGAVYVFDNEVGKLVYSLPGKTDPMTDM